MNTCSKMMRTALAALLAVQCAVLAAPAGVRAAETATELARYDAGATAVIDQTSSYRDIHYPVHHQGGSTAAYNVKTGNGTERQAYYKFELPDPGLVGEADRIYFSIKGKSNAGKGELIFTVTGVTYNDWTADPARQDAAQDAASSLLTWNNAPARYNSQKSGGVEIGYELASPDVEVTELGGFTTKDNADDEYRIDVTDFVKSRSDGAVTFLVRGTKTDASSLYNAYSTGTIASGAYGSTGRTPALILQKVEGDGPNLPYYLAPSGVTASADDGNIPANTVDDNRYTRWSAQNMAGQEPQWIQYDLGVVKPIGYLGIAFYSGASRVAVFDIAVSDDGEHWTAALTDQRSAETDEAQPVDMHALELAARYVRFIGHGNLSANPAQVDWNSLTEFQIYGPHPDKSAVIVPVPYIEPETPEAVPFTLPGLHLPDGTPYAPHTPHVTTGARLNVLDFGADPADSDHDDTPAIIDAVTAAKSGDEVYLPDGVYNLIGQLDASTNFELKSGVNLIGESEEGTVLLSYLNEKGNTRVIKAFNKHDIVIANLTITSTFERSGKSYSTDTSGENPDIGGFGNGIYIDQSGNSGSSNITIEHVTIEHFQRMGIRINKSRDITVRHSTFRNATDVGGGGAGYGIAIQGEPKRDPLGEDIDTYFVTVEGNAFLGPYLRHGVVIQYYAHNNLVQNNRFDGTLLDSIDLHGEDEYLNEIRYNLVQNVPGGGIGVGNTGGTPPNSNHDAAGPFNYIHHNTVNNTRDGILVYMGSPDTLIEANEITGTTDYPNAAGIQVLNGPRTIVRDNVITGNTANGFWAIVLAHDEGDAKLDHAGAGDPADVRIVGNTLTGNANGLKIAAGTNITVRENTIRDNRGRNLQIDVALADTDLDLGSPPDPDSDSNTGTETDTGASGSTGTETGTSAPPKTESLPDGTVVISGLAAVPYTREDGTSGVRVTLDEDAAADALARFEDGARPRVELRIDEHGGLLLELAFDLIERAQQLAPDAVFVVRTPLASFELPQQLLHEALRQSGLAGAATVTVAIASAPEDAAADVAAAVSGTGGRLVSDIVSFDIFVTGANDSTAVTFAYRDFGNRYVTRTIPLSAPADPSRTTVVRYDAKTNALTFVPAVFETSGGRTTAIFRRTGNSIYAVMTAADPSFADIERSWARDDIALLAAKRVISGVSAAAFEPDRLVTRAEFAAMLIRALGLAGADDAPPSSGFTDIAAQDWYSVSVAKAETIGLVRGSGNGLFLPNGTISREEMAVMAAQALSWAQAATQAAPTADASDLSVEDASLLGDAEAWLAETFADAGRISGWARPTVAQVAASGLMVGEAPRSFAPQAPVTRAQAAAVIRRLLEHLAFING